MRNRSWLLAAVLVSAALVLIGMMRWTVATVAQTATSADARQKREELYRLNNLGVALMEQYKHEDAVKQFKQALERDAGFAIARINLAIALAHRGDIQGARHEYDEAVRLEPNDTNSYYWRGLFLAEQGDLAASVADLQAAVAHSKVPARELKALAETLVRAGRMQEARQAVERGSALDPNLFGELRAKVGVQG